MYVCLIDAHLDTALLQAEQVFKMAPPIGQNLRFLRDWLSRPKSGDNFLRGLEASIWDSQNTHDLVALGSRPGERDKFTNWITNTFLVKFHRYIGCYTRTNRPKDPEAGYTEYSESKLTAFLQIIITLLASMLPFLATVSLYLVKGMPIRLAMIALFMLIFCMTLAVSTNGRRVEIFAATAAYVLLNRFALTHHCGFWTYTTLCAIERMSFISISKRDEMLTNSVAVLRVYKLYSWEPRMGLAIETYFGLALKDHW